MVDEESWDTPLFTHLHADIVGSILAFLTTGVSSMGGIGGGGLLVPLYMMVLGLGRFAIPLSKATLFGASLSNVAMRCLQRHPHADRPLMAFDVATMLEPMVLTGTVAGVMLNATMPQWLISLLLMLLLGITTLNTLRKGLRAWRAEDARLDAQVAGGASGSESPAAWSNGVCTPAGGSPGPLSQEGHTRPLLNGGAARSDGDDAQSLSSDRAADLGAAESGRAEIGAAESAAARLVALVQAERTAPWWMVGVLTASWAAVLATSLLRGGHGAPTLGTTPRCGSLVFWLLTLAPCATAIGATAFTGGRLAKQHLQKIEVGYAFAEGDVRWEGINLTLLPVACTLAGVAAGGLGIGGGMVKTPLMLELGILPSVAAATAALMILFTESASSVQVGRGGRWGRWGRGGGGWGDGGGGGGKGGGDGAMA